MSKFLRATAFEFVPAVVPKKSGCIFSMVVAGTAPGVGQFGIIATDIDSLKAAFSRVMEGRDLDESGIQQVAIFQRDKVHTDFSA